MTNIITKHISRKAYNAPTYRAYLKVFRKYIDINIRKLHEWTRMNIVPVPYYFVCFDVTDKERLSEVRRHRVDDSLRCLLDEFERDGGRIVRWTGMDIKGKFTGIRITDFDFYYLYEADGETHMQSAVVGYSEISE